MFDGLPNAADLVRRQVIHHHDIAGGEFRNEHLLDVSSERLTVHRSVLSSSVKYNTPDPI